MNLTERFPASIAPARPGVYLTQRKKSATQFWRAFDGKAWRYGAAIAGEDASPSYEDARHKTRLHSNMANFEWQGLAEKPE